MMKVSVQDARKWRGAALLLIVIILCAILVLGRGSRHGPGWDPYNRGVDALAQGRLLDGVRELESAIRLDPHFAEPYELLATTYLAASQPNQSLDVLARLRAVEPGRPYLATRIAEAYVPLDNVLALRWAREAVIQEPRSPRAHILLALGLARSGSGRAAFLSAVVAQEIAHSTTLAAALKEMAPLKESTAELARRLRALILDIPYQ